MKNKKTKVAIISVIALILVTIAVTYAYWLVTKTQTGENEISSACLDISISGEKNDIELTNQFPMSDEDGMKLVPYEFTVTNNCNTSVDYQVALEATGEEESAIASSSIKVALNDTVTPLSSNTEINTTISGAYEARKLGTGTLASSGNEGSSATYELRIWIDKDAPISEMSKTFKSKISVTIGQGVSNSSGTNTLAYAVLSSYGGKESITTLSAEWTEGTYGTETYRAMNKSTSYYWGTEMNFNETNGKYKLGGTVVQATTTECRNGQLSDGTAITCSYTLINSTDAEYETSTGYKVTALTNSSKNDTSSTLYITAQKTGTASNPFSKATTANEAGLYKTQDDLGDSYYFRGAPTNNYVEFGTYAEDTILTIYDKSYNEITFEVKAGTSMYWRIVRINGDGTIRLAYDGIEKVENGVDHTPFIAHTTYNPWDDPKYVGYTYDDGTGTQVDSIIKGVVDIWYTKHLAKNFGPYIADGIFCNDKTIDSYVYHDKDYNDIIDPTQAAYTDIYYGAYARLSSNKTPSAKCENKSDRYTMNDTKNGNGLLINPVGLLTADELLFAGTRSASYLYSVLPYWSLSPYMYYDYGPNNIGSMVYDIDGGRFVGRNWLC